jgi:hypothetical protein
MRDGENCEKIDYAQFDTAVARIRACLTLTAEEIMRRKLACRQSAQFHPQSFVEAAKVLFPDLRGETL